jgi:uncharacterized membrane protein YwzB
VVHVISPLSIVCILWWKIAILKATAFCRKIALPDAASSM